MRQQDAQGKEGVEMLCQLARSPAVSVSLCSRGWEEAEEQAGREKERNDEWP